MPSPARPLIALLIAASALSAGESVTAFMYSEYIDPSLVAEFTKRTGYDLKIEVYEAQEDMIAKLQTGGTDQYDVVVATDVIIKQMIALKLVQPLDQQLIPNRANVAKTWLNPPFDANNQYTYPYFWGSVGIMYDTNKVKASPCSWKWVLDPAAAPGPYVLLDEAKTMLGCTLLAMGKDINSVDLAEVRAAKDKLVAAKKGAKCLGFDSGTGGKNKVLAGEAAVAVVFNGDAARAALEKPNLRYEVPVEGGNLWVDVMLVTSKAPNKKGAHALVNFLLDADIAARNANFIHYASPIEAALPKITPEDLKNPAIYPPAAVMSKLLYLQDLGKASKLWDSAWTAVKSE